MHFYHYYREETEKPEIWAKICIQRMVELAKESTTMRRVLDPMFVYFDSRQHWAPRNGLAMMVLSSMAYFMENMGIILSYQSITSGSNAFQEYFSFMFIFFFRESALRPSFCYPSSEPQKCCE